MPRFLTFINAYFATMPILVGLLLLLAPDFIIPLMFKNPPVSTANAELVDILRKGFAIRDIYMGITTWAAIYHRSRRVIGWVLLAGACVVVVDGYALHEALGRGLWDHYVFLPVLLGCGLRQAVF
ncbi:hypothetical protein BT63DRAFT_270583 [Microthyrium microscopicum]|uniref:EXPERA domain-containing protein n=1 Tax=Microthyrium microscopicum TaxID=703497 RepID=A0A6A6U7F7_9PEZI|nr:hypothetical protein BT63DRAFT_270583 [Microthyrium microscopicum]